MEPFFFRFIQQQLQRLQFSRLAGWLNVDKRDTSCNEHIHHQTCFVVMKWQQCWHISLIIAHSWMLYEAYSLNRFIFQSPLHAIRFYRLGCQKCIRSPSLLKFGALVDFFIHVNKHSLLSKSQFIRMFSWLELTILLDIMTLWGSLENTFKDFGEHTR